MLVSGFARALLAVAVATAMAAASADDSLEYGAYATTLNSVNCTFNKTDEKDVSMVKLYFYNSESNVNTSHYINNAGAEILDQPDFNFNHAILLWIPGFGNTINTTDQDVVRNNLYGYLNSYLIIVDSSYYTNNTGTNSYQRSVSYYYNIGRALADFIIQLKRGGVNLDNVKVYGHSLGGQIAGAVGEAYKNKTGALLRYIMGIDPAGPCFHNAGKEYQVRSGNAVFVVVIHCNKGVLGTIDDLGHAVFNANGGVEQPGCRALPVQGVDMDAETASCSHEGCVVIATLPAHQPRLWNTSACIVIGTFNKTDEKDVSMVKLYFYNSESNVNTSHYINNAGAEILDQPDFNFNHAILLWIPGFGNTINTTDQDVVRNNLYGYLNSYLIIVDSSYYTNNTGTNSYQRSVSYYYNIGRALADFIIQLKRGGVNLDNVKVYGHSLGGQIAGAVGEAYKNKTGALLRYIMGIDPAGPCFHNAGKEYQVRSGNAVFVVVIHCNKGVLGTIDDLGHAVFNANGGVEQPGCRALPVQGVDMDAETASCSHEGCVVIATLPAHQPRLWNTSACDSEEHYDSGACVNHRYAHLDLEVEPSVRGTYYFNTTGYTNFTTTQT